MLEHMFEVARIKLATITETVGGLPAPQASVLLTDKDNIYVAVNDLYGAICDELKQNDDTKVNKLLTIWKNGVVDLSSIQFRSSLVEINEQNNNTDIILKGTDGYLIKKLVVTLS